MLPALSQSLTLVTALTSDRHCFVSLPRSAFAGHQHDFSQGPAIILVEWTPPPLPAPSSSSPPPTPAPARAYVGWAGTVLPASSPPLLTLSSSLASSLSLPSSHLVQLTLLPPSSPCPSITLTPVTPDDWEILSLHPSHLEYHLLEQVQVVARGQRFPYHVDGGGRIECRVDSVKGPLPYGRIGLMTEVVVAPNVRRRAARAAGKGEEGPGPLPRRWRLRVQMWEEREEDANDVGRARPHCARCVYVSEATLQGLRLRERDLVVVSSSSRASAASSSSPADASTASRVVCRLLVHPSAAPHHAFVHPALLAHLRLPYFASITVAALHPHVAAVSSKHIQSVSLTPLLSSAFLPPLSSAEESALTAAFLYAVQRWGKDGIPVEGGGVMEVEAKDGSNVWRVRVGINETVRPGVKAAREKEQERERDDENQRGRPRLALNVPQPLSFFLLCDPQQLHVVTTAKIPPLPLPMPSVLSPASVPPFSPSLPVPSHVLEEVGGLSAFVSTALSHLLSFLHPAAPPSSSGLLLTADDGSGKSMIAHALAYRLYTRHAVSVHVLASPLPPQGKAIDRLRAVIAQAGQCQPSLVLIEDAHVLLPATGEQDGAPTWDVDALAAAFCHLLTRLQQDGQRVVFLLTATSAAAVHASLSSAAFFPTVLEVPGLKPEDREDVLQRVMRKRGVLEKRRGVCRRVSEKLEGYRGRDLEQVVLRAIHAAISRRWGEEEKDDSAQLALTSEDFAVAVTDFVPSNLKSIASSTSSSAAVDWAHIGGYAEVKATLTDTLKLPTEYAPLFSRLPLKLRSGLLLYGPPGCGKTVLATAVAAHAGLNLIAVKGPELLNKYIGSSEAGVRDVFVRARGAAPCLLFFDEMEAIATKRGGESTGVTDRVVNQFLCELDGVEGGAAGDGRVYVLAATSRPDLLDAALLRPGRIDKSVYVGFPTEDERRDILTLSVQRERGAEQAAALADCVARIAGESAGYSGADLGGVLTNAQMLLVHDYLDRAKAAEDEGDSKGEQEEERLPVLTEAVLYRAFVESSPSVSARDRKDFERLYSRFIAAKEGNQSEPFDPRGKGKTTQA